MQPYLEELEWTRVPSFSGISFYTIKLRPQFRESAVGGEYELLSTEVTNWMGTGEHRIMLGTVRIVIMVIPIHFGNDNEDNRRQHVDISNQ